MFVGSVKLKREVFTTCGGLVEAGLDSSAYFVTKKILLCNIP